MAVKYWLMKSEPSAFSIEDLKRSKTTLWDGIRNYQARNFMIKSMSKGDKVLFYHSNTKPPGVVGLATISKNAQPDPTQFDKKSQYYDAKSKPKAPRWHCVEVKYWKTLKSKVSLDEIRENPKLQEMCLIQKGSRLSIQPVSKKEFELIVEISSTRSK